MDGGKRYLRLDFSIDCDSGPHQRMTLYDVIMVFVYPLGVRAAELDSSRHQTAAPQRRGGGVLPAPR